MREYVYSRNAVYEALRARRRQVFTLLLAEGLQPANRLTDITKLAAERKCKIERVSRARLDKIHPQHQGVALEASGYPYADLTEIFERAEQRAEPLFVLLLDTLNDPQNFGTLLRSAEAVGVQGVIIPLARTVEVTPAVVNASSGASEHLLVTQANLHQAIAELKQAGAWIVGLEGSAQATEAQQVRLDGALGLVVGSEGQGMRALTRKSCDILMKFPMRGRVESLNAAVAGSVALYLALMARQRRA